jgi:hypothetical protein
MLWREEQRAIGELMRKTGGTGCVGYSTFINNYDRAYSVWFQRFAGQLQSMFSLDKTGWSAALSDEPGTDSERLALLQGILAMLLIELDINKSVVNLGADGELAEPGWARQSNYPEPTKYQAQLKGL